MRGSKPRRGLVIWQLSLTTDSSTSVGRKRFPSIILHGPSRTTCRCPGPPRVMLVSGGCAAACRTDQRGLCCHGVFRAWAAANDHVWVCGLQQLCPVLMLVAPVTTKCREDRVAQRWPCPSLDATLGRASSALHLGSPVELTPLVGVGGDLAHRHVWEISSHPSSTI